MSSVNECFLFSFPHLLFCLLVVSIISRVMSHTSLTYFPLTLPVSFSHPHSHTHRWAKIVFILTLSYTHIHTHTHSFGIISYGAHLFLNNLFFIILPLVCFVLSVTFVCFVFWTYENSISILCKQTTTPSVITIGSLPIHLPSPTILLSLTQTHTHTHTIIHLHTCTHIHSH